MTEQQRQFILALCAYAALRDIPVPELTTSCGIDLQKLMKGGESSVSREQMHKLLRTTSRACKDELLGLHFGESLQLGALGVVGEIIKSSKAVGESISIAASLTPIITDLYTMEVKRDKDDIVVHYQRTKASADALVEKLMLDFLLVFTIQELDGFLLRKIKPKSVTLNYQPHEEYRRVLRCMPSWEKTVSIRLDSSYWNEPIITANYEFQTELLKKLNVAPTETETYHVKVMEYLLKNSYMGIKTLEDVAANFNITPRSLQRRLKEESTSFQQIADEVRKSLALHYLEKGKYQLKEISYFLGYNELSAFSRAFKRWTGKAPQRYIS
jgi:AraC-like DNA-binding protein